MDEHFRRVVRRARPLGNPAGKYLRAIERGGGTLVARLEAAGRLSRVHLDRSAPSVVADFEVVAAAGRDADESLALLGTYYAVQYLHLNARAFERLAVELAESGERDRFRAYADFLKRAETDFAELVGAYIRRVLRLLAPPELRRTFLLCAVGSRGHQDDIDVAVLDAGGTVRAATDRLVGRLTVHMLRHASALDHYLASRLRPGGLVLSVDELEAGLGGERLDIPAVTEILRAEPIAGERSLLEPLRARVVAPFLYRAEGDNARHEFFLRGLLGEIRSLLLRPPPVGTVNPKEDALRLILGLVLALAAADGVTAPGTRALLRQVRARRPGSRPLFAQLERSLVFLETFHQLAHLLIAEDEDVEVEGDAARENLRRLGEAMGYADRGPVRGVDRLLTHYQEAVAAAHEVAPALMDEIAGHLRTTGRLAPWIAGRGRGDFATEFVTVARGYRGARFWDDVLDALAAPDGRLLAALAGGFSGGFAGGVAGGVADGVAGDTFTPEHHEALAQSYAEWGRDAPYALLTILTLLAERHRGAPRSPGHEQEGAASAITRAYLGWLGVEAEHVRALSRTFRFYPRLLNRFLLTLDREALQTLEARLDVAIGNPEVAAARDRFRAFIAVHRRTSRYVQRVLARVTERVPATVLALDDGAALHTIALGRLAESERHPSAEPRKQLLGDYYDVEFLRLAVGTLHEPPGPAMRADFGDVTRTYFGDLFDACLREAEREIGARMLQRDVFGFYLAGAHARGRPFGEDYDAIALLDSADPEDRALAERAVVLMNRQIARRGVVIQYRLGERLGRFVASVDDLVRLAEEAPDDFFVDLHQLLGARQIAGSRRVDSVVLERVIDPFVHRRGEVFAALLANEVRERRRRLIARPEGTLHVKNMRGGLRELDLCLGARRARLGVRETEHPDPFAVLAARDPAHADAYTTLGDAEALLVAVRSAYRVVVAATDVIERDYLDAPARCLGFEGAAAAYAAAVEAGARAAVAIDELLGLA